MDNQSIAAESFQTPIPLPKWANIGSGNASSENDDEEDKAWNCFGVVHVRLLAAQRLPCPVGSSISATVSLLPWRGRVRTSQTAAFSMSVGHGVCVAWDPKTDNGVCSMVHAWSSEDSPVPDIKIELNFSPLGFGLFEFKMASLTLPCEVLFRSPCKWKRQWCLTEQDAAAKRDATGLGPILIQLEAIFIPGPVNMNDYLPDPDLLENHIGYVDKDENTVSRMSEVDNTSIDSDYRGMNDESITMENEEADEAEKIEESPLELAENMEPITLCQDETKFESEEEQTDVSASNHQASNIQESEDLPDAVPTEDSLLDQEPYSKEQNDLSTDVPLVDLDVCHVAMNHKSDRRKDASLLKQVPTQEQIEPYSKEQNDSSMDATLVDLDVCHVTMSHKSDRRKVASPFKQVPIQEQLDLPETATAADLLSYLLHSEKERDQAEQRPTDSLHQTASALTPTKPVTTRKELDLTISTHLSSGQEQTTVEKVESTVSPLDPDEHSEVPTSSTAQNASVDQMKSKPALAVETESDPTTSAKHIASPEESDAKEKLEAATDQSDQSQTEKMDSQVETAVLDTTAPLPNSKKEDPDLLRLVTTAKSPPRNQIISDQEPVREEKEDSPKKSSLSVSTPTQRVAKNQDSDLPSLVTTTKSVQKNPTPENSQVDRKPPRTPTSKSKQTTPRMKNIEIGPPKLVNPTNRSSKNMTPNRVQVDMSAVVKAARSGPANSVASNNDGASVSVLSTANNTMYSTQNGRHLLRVVNFWVPSKCSVCQTTLFGRKSGSQCEVCHIDCCSDCRLNVDVRVPCGPASAHATKKKKASMESFLSFVAPDETFERSRKSLMEATIDEGTVFNEDDLDFSSGIGYLKLSFLQAAIFKQPLPSEEYPEKVFAVNQKEKLFQGDYYARISISDSPRTGRTPTVQKSGLPQFRSNQLFFGIEDYGREFRLDIIDSNTDSIVGSATLTTQGILQMQRDAVVQREGASLFQFTKGPIKASGTQEIKVPLRSDAKNGLFVSNDRSSDKKPSCIIGWLEIEVGIEEYTEKLLSNDFDCPKRVHPAFRMSNLQGQLQRVKFLLEDVKSVIDGIKYTVSWENPFLTAAALYIHVLVCIRFNSEYGGSIPFVIIIFWMLYARHRRFSIPTASKEGNRKSIPKSSDEKDTDSSRASKAMLTRQIGSVTVDVTKGADLLSQDGIPGKTSCHVLWDPTRCAGKRMETAMKKLDKASRSPFEIGHTDTRYSAQPTWELSDSQWNKRLKGLLPPDETISSLKKRDVTAGLSFPVLQPLEMHSPTSGADGESSDIRLASWDNCPGAVIFQVYFSDLLLGLGVEYEIGEVIVPFTELVKKQRISGWFDVTSGTQDHVVSVASNDADSKIQGMKPRIHITLSWQPPNDDQSITKETSRELSLAIQEELSQFSHSKRTNIIDSSLGAVNTALGLGGNLQDVQNSVISVLDLVESVINLFNFTDPFKSSLIFWAVVSVWVVFLIIPTRFIFLLGGLGLFWATFDQQYGITKLKIFKKKVTATAKPIEHVEMKEEKSDGGNVIMNAIRSLPTREDLRKASYWDKLRVDHIMAEKRESKKREARLKKLWKSQWFSNVRLKEQSDKDREILWAPAFAVVQGRYFLWWHHARDFDKGEPPAGKVSLSGHAGLTGPSPLEMRELSSDDLSCFVGIFGRGLEGQERISILTESSDLKGSLEDVILHLESKND